MKCEYCGAELPEGTTVCPDCGKILTEQKQEKNPWKPTALVAIGVLVVALAAALIFAGANRKKTPEETVPADTVAAVTTEATEATEATVPADGDPGTVTCKGSYTVDDEQIRKAADTVVATSGDNTLTNAQLQIYYWMQFYSFVDNYGSVAPYLGLDVNAPLDTQLNQSEGGITWQQFFLTNALDNWHLYNALAEEAAAADFQISDELRGYLDSLEENMQASAEAGNFASIEEMIQFDMGSGCGYQEYLDYILAYYTGSEYFGSLYDAMTPTPEEVEAYFDAHAEEFAADGVTRDTVTVDVRHILVMPDGEKDENGEYTEAAWEACREQGQTLLDAWLEGDMTEESFAALATEKTQDPGSAGTGGLYTDVTVGMMVEPFNDWCFDPARQVGDYGLVKTSYGYHVMYFVGSHTVWEAKAEQGLLAQQARDLLEEVKNRYPITVDYASIALALPAETEQ